MIIEAKCHSRSTSKSALSAARAKKSLIRNQLTERNRVKCCHEGKVERIV